MKKILIILLFMSANLLFAQEEILKDVETPKDTSKTEFNLFLGTDFGLYFPIGASGFKTGTDANFMFGLKTSRLEFYISYQKLQLPAKNNLSLQIDNLMIGITLLFPSNKFEYYITTDFGKAFFKFSFPCGTYWDYPCRTGEHYNIEEKYDNFCFSLGPGVNYFISKEFLINFNAKYYFFGKNNFTTTTQYITTNLGIKFIF